MSIHPLTRLDYPDPDVIRVGDTYYMATTTMHFFPGGEVLRSKDLIHWEHAAYVYDRLDSTPGQQLQDGQHIYGKGMWAASLRYHEGTFYYCFVANDTHRTYLYTASDIKGPWEKHTIDGFYHDCSLLFDEGRVYIAYGNMDIRITELKSDLSGPKEGGLDRIAVSDRGNPYLGYEGTHFYRIGGKYYLFFIHSRRDRWRRTKTGFRLTMRTQEADNDSLQALRSDALEETEVASVEGTSPSAQLRAEVDFWQMQDEVIFRFRETDSDAWQQPGPAHKLYFKMDHFVDCRFRLFLYAMQEPGGSAEFSRFIYNTK